MNAQPAKIVVGHEVRLGQPETRNRLHVSRTNPLAELPTLHSLGEAHHHRLRRDLFPASGLGCDFARSLRLSPYFRGIATCRRSPRMDLAACDLFLPARRRDARAAQHAYALDVWRPGGNGLGPEK